jgi:hypothetical protein
LATYQTFAAASMLIRSLHHVATSVTPCGISENNKCAIIHLRTRTKTRCLTYHTIFSWDLPCCETLIRYGLSQLNTSNLGFNPYTSYVYGLKPRFSVFNSSIQVRYTYGAVIELRLRDLF